MKKFVSLAVVAVLFIVANILIDMGQETSPSFLRAASADGSKIQEAMTSIRTTLPAGRYLPMLGFIGGIIGGIILASIKREGFWSLISFNKEGLLRAAIGVVAGFLIMVAIRFGYGEFYKTWRFQAGIFVMEPAHIIMWAYAIISGVVLARIVRK